MEQYDKMKKKKYIRRNMMTNYEIYTDSSCDLPVEIVKRYGLQVMQLEVMIDDEPPVLNCEIDSKTFYERLRNGANAKTAAVTPGYFEEHMRATLEAGKDILYLGFTSGLSVTYANGAMICEMLRQEYPDRTILYTDTLCASIGQGLVVYFAAGLREQGKTAQEVLQAVENIKQRIHHQVTVNDLFFLKRGGRISAATAVAGTVLNVKPVIVVDEAGKLANIGKARGRKGSLNELYSRLERTEKLEELGLVCISHSDCIEDAEYLAGRVREDYPGTEIIISDIGPVIGAHTGPGAIALCHIGRTNKGKLE